MSSEPIKPDSIESYRLAMGNLVTAAKMISLFDLPAMINSIERAESIGPIIDPTLYRDKRQAMGEDRQLLEAALPLWKFARQLAKSPDPQATRRVHPSSSLLPGPGRDG